jgi:hypothetical protein
MSRLPVIDKELIRNGHAYLCGETVELHVMALVRVPSFLDSTKLMTKLMNGVWEAVCFGKQICVAQLIHHIHSKTRFISYRTIRP